MNILEHIDVASEETIYMISRGIMWQKFLNGYVTDTCLRACWERWLPQDIVLNTPGYYEIYPEVYVNPEDIINEGSGPLCERLVSARAFQRCYISQCAGLNAKIPAGVEVTNTRAEMKLWAWTSVYVARYGRGPSSFENYIFSSFPETDSDYTYLGQRSGQDVWKPFTVGLTAACVMASWEVFTESATSASTKRTMELTSADNRIRMPQSLRKLLVPIWISPGLIDLWDQMLPQYWIEQHPCLTENMTKSAEAEFGEPRELTDIVEKIIPVYIFTGLAYTHWLWTLSESRRPTIEAIQILSNCLLPVFSIVQFLHGFIDAASLMLSGEPWEYPYLLAGALGTIVFDDRVPVRPSSNARLLSLRANEVRKSKHESRSFTWWLKVLGIAMNTVPLLVAVVQYFSRLMYKFRNHTYCATTGFDHRVGWVAFSALTPVIATTILHIQNRKWTPNQLPHQNSFEGDGKTRVALQVFASAVIFELLLHLTGRVTLVQVTFGRFLTNHIPYIVTAISLIATVLATMWRPLSLRYGREGSQMRKMLPWMFLGASLTYATLLFFLQLFMDMEEYADLALDFVLPWNFRWERPDPTWTRWWSR